MMKAQKLLLNKYRVMRLLALFTMVMALLILYSTVPAYYQDGLNGTEWQFISFLSLCVLTTLHFYLYGAKRDVTAQGGKTRRLSGSTKEFFFENRLCTDCGQKCIPVLEGTSKKTLLPVPPGATTGGAKTLYYCAHCRQARLAEDCVPAPLRSARISRAQLAPLRYEMHAAPAYKLNRRFLIQSVYVTLGLFALAVGSVFLAAQHFLLLLPMWLCWYLFIVSAYNALNNALLRYQPLSGGLLQRDAMGCRFYPWQRIIAVLSLPPYTTQPQSAGVYTELENLVLSPIIENYDALIANVRTHCPQAASLIAIKASR